MALWKELVFLEFILHWQYKVLEQNCSSVVKSFVIYTSYRIVLSGSFINEIILFYRKESFRLMLFSLYILCYFKLYRI